MTSVALMRATAASPGLRASSRAPSAVMMAVTRWVPTASTTLASRPSMVTSTMVPSNWLRPLMRAAPGRATACGQEFLQRLDGNAMVAARRLDGADAPGQDPVFQRGIADAELLGGLARREQGGRSHRDGPDSPKAVLYTFEQGLRAHSLMRDGISPCDCSHSTAVDTDDSASGGFSPGFSGAAFPESFVDTASNLNLGGNVTAQDWVYFFLGVSVFSLIVAVFFARQVMGSNLERRTCSDCRSHQGRRGGISEAAVQDRGGSSGPAASHIRLRARRNMRAEAKPT